jgi:hypothetical protein
MDKSLRNTLIEALNISDCNSHAVIAVIEFVRHQRQIERLRRSRSFRNRWEDGQIARIWHGSPADIAESGGRWSTPRRLSGMKKSSLRDLEVGK